MEWYLLKLVKIKNSKIRNLMEKYNDFLEVLNEKEDVLLELGLDEEDIKKIKDSLGKEKIENFKKEIEKRGVGVISLKDEIYPENLKNIAKPPLFLFYKGRIELLKLEKKIGVVGARKVTKYGEMCVNKVIKELVEGECVIVSGLAQGVDSLAHAKTLEEKGNTIAILGCGIDKIYPKDNYKLRERIEKSGLVLSEFPLGTSPLSINFPIRNRVIAGLSKGVVVIESAKKGGSLITAEIALEENREVFAIPGDINSPMSVGCNELIKNSQAKLIVSGNDILEEMGWKKITKENEKSYLKDEKLKIYEIVRTKMNLDEIKREIKLETKELLRYLMELELEGYIESVSGGYYIRKL